MPLALRASSNTGAFALQTTLTITKPVGLTAGDLMIAQIHTCAASAITPPSGWTLGEEAARGGSGFMCYYWKTATAGDVAAANFAFGVSNAEHTAGGILAFYNTDVGSSALIHTDTWGIDGTAPTVTPVANCIFVFLVGSFETVSMSGYAMATSNPAWTELYDFNTTAGNDFQMSAAYSAVRPQSTATGAFTVTSSGGSNDAVIVIAVAPLTNATGTTALLEDGEETVFAPTASAGTRGTAVLLEDSEETVPAPTARATHPTQWTNPDKPGASSWSNPDKP